MTAAHDRARVKLAPSVEAVIDACQHVSPNKFREALISVAIAQAQVDAEICKLYDPGACETSPLYIRRAILASVGLK